MTKCPNCGCDEIDYDQARGDAVCVECGTVLEQNLIVNEVGFSEDARGRSNVIGQHVRADGRLNTFNVLPGFSREATELTMQHGRRRIGHIASALRLTSRHTDSALQLFRLAVERNFHKGRRMANVCCACLYAVCRIHKTAHMLLDFADVLETNVYVLGHTFLKFAQVLSIQLPIIDPSLYIHRFASKLEFGDKTHIVAMSALRVMARMQRDWMSAGRRPSGLCGAALVAAAGMHNFYRSVGDVARVVRIGNVVLRERLQELDKTTTATMTAAQIDAGGGDDGKEGTLAVDEGGKVCDPPAFQRLQAKKVAVTEHAKKLQEVEDVDEGENAENVGAGENAAEKTSKESGTAQDVEMEDPDELEIPGGSSKTVRIAPGKTGRTAADAQLEEELTSALASTELQQLDHESEVTEKLDVASCARLQKESRSGNDEGQEGEQNDEIEKRNELEPEDKDQTDEDDNGELSDLDDEDASKYLNTEEEYERKKELWTEINKEYLENQEKLETMKRERPEEYKRIRPWRASQKKRKTDALAKAGRSGEGADGNSEPESPPPPPQPKASKKLNYSVLKSLERSVGLGLSGSTNPVPASGDLPPLPPAAPTT